MKKTNFYDFVFENGENIISFYLSGKLSYTWATH